MGCKATCDAEYHTAISGFNRNIMGCKEDKKKFYFGGKVDLIGT